MKKNSKKVTALAALGAGFEYYDFVIYGLLASTTAPLFFPGKEGSALLKTFAVFAAGYVARFFGGLFFGALGDAYGRKNAFVRVMFLMAGSTFAIGILPTYETAGFFAPAALLLLRLLQGFSFGAELPGAVTVVTEHCETEKRGRYTGFVISSVSVGAGLASVVLYLLSEGLGAENMTSYGWRIPFLLGGTLSFVNFFIRKHLNETPEFSALQKSRTKVTPFSSIFRLMRDHKRSVAIGMLMTCITSGLVIFFLYFPSYIATRFGYGADMGYLAVTWGMIWSSLSLPLCGRIADLVGREKTYLLSCLVLALTVLPLFSLLGRGDRFSLFLFTTVYQTAISCLSVCYFPLISSLFPTEVRYTGISFCYNLVYSVTACVPMLTIGLKNTPAAPVVIGALALVGAFGSFLRFASPFSSAKSRI